MNICPHALTGVNTGVGIPDAEPEQNLLTATSSGDSEAFDPDFNASASIIEALVFGARDAASFRAGLEFYDEEMDRLDDARLDAIFGPAGETCCALTVEERDVILPLRSHAEWKRRFRRWRRAAVRQAHLARARVAVAAIGRQRVMGRQQRNQRRSTARGGGDSSDASSGDPQELRAKADGFSEIAMRWHVPGQRSDLVEFYDAEAPALRRRAGATEQAQANFRRLTNWGAK